MVIGFALPRTFGRMVGDKRQGLAIVAVMAVLSILSVIGLNLAQGAHHGSVPTAVGAASEGTETRFGVLDSATFASATTLTSTGAVDSMHDSYTSLGGAITLIDMQLGEVAPGGTGSGLYGILVLAVITVFVGRLDGRSNAGVPGQEDRGARDEVLLAVLPDDAGVRTHRHGGGDGVAR